MSPAPVALVLPPGLGSALAARLACVSRPRTAVLLLRVLCGARDGLTLSRLLPLVSNGTCNTELSGAYGASGGVITGG